MKLIEPENRMLDGNILLDGLVPEAGAKAPSLRQVPAMPDRPLTHLLCLAATVLILGWSTAGAGGNIHYPHMPPAMGISVPGMVLGQAATSAEPDEDAPANGEEAEEQNEDAQADDPLAFLRRVEEKNAGVQSLHGRFHQVRKSSVFLEEIQSRGEFWYSHPSLFRCDYFEPSELRYYLLDNTAYIYTPELNQVEQITMDKGDGAAINQLLVGFGLDVDMILEVFEVKLATEQPGNPDRLVIDFLSTDLDRSLGYNSIRITFDRELLEPRLLEMEQEDDTVTVRLDSVDRDVEIDPAKFRAEFPPNVEIHRF